MEKSMKSINTSQLKSILLVDDDQEKLDILTNLLNQKTKAKIITSKFPSQALLLAQQSFFDFIILDVTMQYHDNPYGGFDLYKNLLNRYGKDSIIAYSQYITDELIRKHNYPFNFIEIEGNLLAFSDKLHKTIEELRKKQTCFVAMPFDSKFDEAFDVISSCIINQYYQCIRVDKENFSKSIVEKIILEITNCKLVLFLATDKNPNVFYEAGYAYALGKEIVTITDFYFNLPFDVRDRNAIEYREDLLQLKNELTRKLESITSSVK